MSTERFYTAINVASKLGVNVMTIYRYIKAGRINAHKIGKEFRISEVEFQRFLKKTSTK
jgi:excisionase family DNA binding protein